jgi:hypothetical protein
MTTSSADMFAALDQDPLEEILSAPLRATPAPVRPAMHEEPCPKCRGTGRFVGWSGRTVGNCFTCKGTGKKMFAQPAAVRADQRAKRQERKARMAAEDAAAFAVAHPDVAAWIAAKAATFGFAASMRDAVAKYGHLTDNQLAACHRCITRDLERQVARASAPPPITAGIDATKIQAAFDKFAEYARNLGPRANSRAASVRLTVGEIKFKPAKATSRNPGAIYVTRGKNPGTYLGKIKDGVFTCSAECDPATTAKIVEIAADPLAAAVAHGQVTGNCAICARELTRHDSIERGIGPICASRMGW